VMRPPSRYATAAFSALALAGCAALASGSDAALSTAPTAAATPLPETRGALQIRILWPTQDLPGFVAQSIPLRTRSIRLTTHDGQDRLVDQQLLVRFAAASDSASTRILLPAGSGYRMLAEAFQESAPATASVPIAVGSAVQLTIRRSRILSVPMTLTAAYAPRLTGFDPPAGVIGRTIRLSGQNFGHDENLPLVVTFGGIAASTIRRVSETELDVDVPEGARSGPLVVWVDGIPSSSLAQFNLLQGLDAELVPGDTLDDGNGWDLTLDSSLPAPEPTPGEDSVPQEGANVDVGTPVAPVVRSHGLDVSLVPATPAPAPSRAVTGTGLEVEIR